MARRDKESNDSDVAFDENATADVTEQEVAEGEKKARTPSRRTVLQNEILAYVIDPANFDSLPDSLMARGKEFAALPVRGGGGERGPSLAKVLREMILEKKEIHEDRFYELFKLGRLEMKRRFYNMRKKISDPKDAVWVSFDPDTGIYKLEGTGAEAPTNWTE